MEKVGEMIHIPAGGIKVGIEIGTKERETKAKERGRVTPKETARGKQAVLGGEPTRDAGASPVGG